MKSTPASAHLSASLGCQSREISSLPASWWGVMVPSSPALPRMSENLGARLEYSESAEKLWNFAARASFGSEIDQSVCLIKLPIVIRTDLGDHKTVSSHASRPHSGLNVILRNWLSLFMKTPSSGRPPAALYKSRGFILRPKEELVA